MSMGTQPADPNKYSVIIGIEFGTTFSSCSYVLSQDDFLKDKFYRHREVDDTAMEAMMETFIDIIKPCFDGDKDQYLPVPKSLDVMGIDDPDKGIDDGMLMISCHELRQHVFEPVCKQVISLIDKQVQTSGTQLIAIFLVGDFGQSTHLFRCLDDEFHSRVGFIGVPPWAELAAVRGAVYFGLDHPIVSEPVSTNTPEPDLTSTPMNIPAVLPQRRKFIDLFSKKK